MLHVVVEAVEDLTVVVVVTTVMMVTMDIQGDTLNPQVKEMFQSLLTRGVAVVVLLVVPSVVKVVDLVVVVVVDSAMRVVMGNVLEGPLSVVVELAEGQSYSVVA